MVFNATFNIISVILWRSVLLVDETGVHRKPFLFEVYQRRGSCLLQLVILLTITL
jgi:hypothetical protein